MTISIDNSIRYYHNSLMNRRGTKGYQGSKWIRREKRLAIYLRDGMACCYCGAAIEDGVRLSLDHLIPYSQGGPHHESNLVTACKRCNDSRGARDWRLFAKKVAAYLNNDIEARQIISHILRTRKRALDVAAAKQLIERRGGFTAALRRAK